MRRHDQAEQLTHQQEQERDRRYMETLRGIPRPTTADTLEEFARQYRSAWLERYPHMRELFENLTRDEKHA